MKKRIFTLMAAILLLASAGCGNNNSTPATTTAGSGTATEAPQGQSGTAVKMWRIGTASMTGNSFTMGSQIAQLINEKAEGMESAAQATGGSSDNCHLLDEKEVELALVNCTSAMQAVNGKEAFEGSPIKSIRSIGIYGLGVVHIIVNNGSNVNTIKDLAGKTIAVGPMGGGTETGTDFIMSEYGVKDYKKIYGSMSEALDAVKMGEADAVFYETTMEAANLVDLLNSGKCRLIGMTKAEADEISKKNPEYNAYTIAAGTYTGHAEDLYTIVSPSFILTREDISEDSVYMITKTIFDNVDALTQQNQMFRFMKADLVAGGMAVPLHPGAEKYFKEIGVLP